MLLCLVCYILVSFAATDRVFKLGQKGMGYYYDAYERSPPFSWSEEHDTVTVVVSKRFVNSNTGTDAPLWTSHKIWPCFTLGSCVVCR